MKTKILPKNRLLHAASPLLRFLAELGIRENEQLGAYAIEEIHHRLVRELVRLKSRLKKMGCDQTQILAGSYCLCACLDEMIMNSTLCQNYDWSKKSLVSITHNETWGGENFYRIYDYAEKRSNTHWELIELIEVLIQFGYKGKLYKSENNGIIDNISLKQRAHHSNINLKIILRNKSSISTQKRKRIFYYCLLGSLLLFVVSLSYYNHKLKVNTAGTLRSMEKL